MTGQDIDKLRTDYELLGSTHQAMRKIADTITGATKKACKDKLKKSGKCDLLDNEIDYLIDNAEVKL